MKRYILDKSNPPNAPARMMLSKSGGWCRWADVERLLIDARLMVHAYQTDSRPHDAWIDRIRAACKGCTDP